MHTWNVRTARYDRDGQLLGYGNMDIDADTAGAAERMAVRLERVAAPHAAEIACKVTHAAGAGCIAYRRAGVMA